MTERPLGSCGHLEIEGRLPKPGDWAVPGEPKGGALREAGEGVRDPGRRLWGEAPAARLLCPGPRSPLGCSPNALAKHKTNHWSQREPERPTLWSRVRWGQTGPGTNRALTSAGSAHQPSGRPEKWAPRRGRRAGSSGKKEVKDALHLSRTHPSDGRCPSPESDYTLPYKVTDNGR